MSGVGYRMGLRGPYKIINVPMTDGRRCRFRVYEDGKVYEIRGAGQVRVQQEPFRTELFDTCWPSDTPEDIEALRHERPWMVVVALVALALVIAVRLLWEWVW